MTTTHYGAPRPCAFCGTPFAPLRYKPVTCSEQCRVALGLRTKGLTSQQAAKELAKKRAEARAAERLRRRAEAEERRQALMRERSRCIDCGAFEPRGDIRKHRCAACQSKAQRARQKARRAQGRTDDHGKHCRRARRLGVAFQYGITAEALARLRGPCCAVCGCRTQRHRGKGWQPRGRTVGHIVALADGGAHAWANVQVECSECNCAKGTRAMGQMALFPLSPARRQWNEFTNDMKPQEHAKCAIRHADASA
jgi:5-methylcytosine-specific restriction endonuclease McrA